MLTSQSPHLFSLPFLYYWSLFFAQIDTVVKTRGGGSSKNRVSADSKATSFASKWQQREASLSSLLAEPPMASSIATKAAKPSPPLVHKVCIKKPEPLSQPRISSCRPHSRCSWVDSTLVSHIYQLIWSSITGWSTFPLITTLFMIMLLVGPSKSFASPARTNWLMRSQSHLFYQFHSKIGISSGSIVLRGHVSNLSTKSSTIVSLPKDVAKSQ